MIGNLSQKEFTMTIKTKIFKVVLIGLFSLGLGACSSASKEDHHHHKAEYNGACAYSMAHGKHVNGKPELNVSYKGKTYYFSEDSMRDHFLDEIKTNVDSANKQWKKVEHTHRDRP